MDYQFNVSRKARPVIVFALFFFWVLLPLLVYMLLVVLFALVSGQAILSRAIAGLLVSIYGLFVLVTGLLQIVNQYNRIRVRKEGLYVEVYAFRYVWKFVPWEEILDLKLLARQDRWGKPQWLLQVKNLTYWHRWISWQHSCGSNPGVLINSDLVDGDKLLNILIDKLE